ncbi:AsnC family transcriptional regulator [Roseivivax halodurans JCM 10272]|uniref:AsnC family transcriptional regulator n=1 Tax=Roseivivax halodurans JCM 10272 TaxID=1449350 RepID=X7EL51_9RHOB|nr:Lrp/AsnC family transcriptional regulator [Roseivivax halodurans]ETX16657.1 AsnC family transcriptional regulator [Roseivivax halodurans JCM 10272]
MLDDTDRRILRQYQATPEAPFAELAERCGVTATTLARRIERMREAGIVRGVRGVIDWSALGYSVEVSLRVTLDKSAPRSFEEFLEAAREVPEVLEIQTFLGQVDVRMSIIARDLAHYQSLYREKLLALPHMTDLEALMHVARLKSDETLPL